MLEKMLRKKTKKSLVCRCHRHHKPSHSWGKSARRQARAAEKSSIRRQVIADLDPNKE